MPTTTEYWLQKKAFNSWSHVTWYSSLDEAKTNFHKVSYEGNGYSWRMVKVDVVEERLNEGERPVVKPDEDDEPYVPNNNTVSIPADDWRKADMGVLKTPMPVASEFKLTWGTPAAGWGKNLTSGADFKSTHASKGSVWVGNPSTKEKKRVPADAAVLMLAEGWIKVGPRTVL